MIPPTQHSTIVKIAFPATAGIHRATRTMFYVYLLASKPHGTLYAAMTDDLVRRVWEHKIKAVPGFTAKYGVDRLVWFEAHETLEPAFGREKNQGMEARLDN